ncbi:hypothetical protein CEXT_491771, partial [Caerostris extrusa]
MSSSYEVLMSVVDGGAFQCRPDCFAECLPDECPAHRQAIEQVRMFFHIFHLLLLLNCIIPYEAVVQRLVSAEEAVRKLQEENQVLKGAQKKVAVGASRAHKETAVEPPSAPTPAPAPTPASPFAAPVPVMRHAARHQISSSCSTQASQLKPEPPRRPGRP